MAAKRKTAKRKTKQTKQTKPSAMLCEHANERPTVCPCEPGCICKKGKKGCLPGKRKSMRDDPEVQSMSGLLMAGRHAERMDILAELEGRIAGTRGWWSKDRPSEDLIEFKRWLEARG